MNIQVPPSFPGPTGLIITTLQLFVTCTQFSTETNAETRAKYSKFSQVASNIESTWPSKFAMMVIYTPALVMSMLPLVLPFIPHHGNYYLSSLIASLPNPSPALALCAIHFAKRCLEVLFLHHYSGRTDRSTPSAIGFYYALITLLIAYGGEGVARSPSALVSKRNMIGTLVFLVGIMGNFYHHYLLAKLRSSGSSNHNSKAKGSNIQMKSYVPPKGGLFSHVATPHYLFELIGWLGIAVVANHLNVFLVVTSMSSYLAGRSVAQNEFNFRKFDEREWPRDRKNLIPFLF